MNKKVRHIYLSISLLLMACGQSWQQEQIPLFAFDEQEVLQSVHEQWQQCPRLMYADNYGKSTVLKDSLLLWVSPAGVNYQADTLMTFLRSTKDEGLHPETFHTEELQTALDSLRSWSVEGQTCDYADSLFSQVEFQLTHAMLRYVYGQRYGYIRPHKLFNTLLEDVDAPKELKQRPYRRLFGIDCDQPSDSLAQAAINSVKEGKLAELLNDVQPTSKLHKLLQEDYKKAVLNKDTARQRLARINLERSRWRYARPDTGRYVFVNLAGYMLTAADTKRDTCFSMRICCGNQSHKSPTLTSQIKFMEFNPYWIVPQTIIRNEVAVLHVHDSAYFARNKMVAIHKESKDTIDPTILSEEAWRSAKYTLQQDKGEGNSLGRIIFRFPNDFSVFLHDTNMPSAFLRTNRAVSHGCIRLERPLDLAMFLLGQNPDRKYVDRIRMSIDLPPLTAEGRKLQTLSPKPLKTHFFHTPISLWIDYYTLYPDNNGQLQVSPDTYSYDKEIEGAMDGF